MNMPKNELVVLDIAGNRARVQCDVSNIKTVLSSLGFVYEDDHMVREIADDSDRQKLVRELITLGGLFTAGRDWSPSELVEYYREQGFVSGSYRVVTWKNPDHYVITVC